MNSNPRPHGAVSKQSPPSSEPDEARQWVSVMPEMAWTAHIDGTWEFCNLQVLTYTGLSDGELAESGWRSVLHLEDLGPWLERWLAALQTGAAFEMVVRLRRLDGVYRWHRGRVVAVQDRLGRPARWLGTFSDIDDMKRLESEHQHDREALNDSEQRLRFVQRIARLGAWDWNVGTDEIHGTDEVFRIFGLDPGSVPLSYGGILERIHPDDRAALDEALQTTRRTGIPFRQRFRVLLPDGRTRSCSTEGELTRDAAGRPSRVYGLIYDDTARLRQEELEQGQHHILELIACGAPLSRTLPAIASFFERESEGALGSILLVDKSGHVHNGATASLPEDYNRAVEGQPIGPRAGSCGTAAYLRHTVVTPDIATDPLWEDYRELALRNGLAASWSTPLFASDGRVVGTLAQYYRTAKDPTPKDVRLTEIAQHLAEIAIERAAQAEREQQAAEELEARVAERTAELNKVNEGLRSEVETRVRIERELRMREKALDEAQEMTHSGSWEWDVKQDKVYWTDELFRIYGLEPQQFEATFDAFLAQIHPEDRERVRGTIIRSFQTHESFSQEERIVRPDGSVRILISSGRVETDGADQTVRMRGTCLDITDLKRAESEVRRLNADLERRVEARTHKLEAINDELEAFSYSVSHDLRAPVRTIDQISELLLTADSAAINDTTRGYLESIQGASRQLGQLIDDLLRLSKLSHVDLQHARVDMSALAYQVVERLRKASPGRSVDVAVTDGIWTDGDPRLLQDALENLLGNAWKFTSKHPRARIVFGQTEQDGRPVYFVRDDGAGFDMKDADRLFKPFSRLHPRDQFEGTGIGLTTVQRIIQRHRGRIWAEATPEKGATFFFTLNEWPAEPTDLNA